jgi:hypothetical protein
MMIGRFAAVMFILLCGAVTASAQLPAKAEKDPRPKPILLGPDLIADGIREMNLNEGKLEVAVRNVGQKASAKSLLRILVTIAGQTNSTGRSKDVRALAPGEHVWVPVSFAKPLNLAKYCAIVDALKQNQETDEKNNERCGEFSGKP